MDKNIIIRIIQHDILARDCNPILTDTEFECIVDKMERQHYEELRKD